MANNNTTTGTGNKRKSQLGAMAQQPANAGASNASENDPLAQLQALQAKLQELQAQNETYGKQVQALQAANEQQASQLAVVQANNGGRGNNTLGAFFGFTPTNAIRGMATLGYSGGSIQRVFMAAGQCTVPVPATISTQVQVAKKAAKQGMPVAPVAPAPLASPASEQDKQAHALATTAYTNAVAQYPKLVKAYHNALGATFTPAQVQQIKVWALSQFNHGTTPSGQPGSCPGTPFAS